MTITDPTSAVSEPGRYWTGGGARDIGRQLVTDGARTDVEDVFAFTMDEPRPLPADAAQVVAIEVDGSAGIVRILQRAAGVAP